jgi:hypothetical protein
MMVPGVVTAATLYGCAAGAITAGRGGTPSSAERLSRGWAEAVSSREHARNTSGIAIEKPKNRRSIEFGPK